MRALLVAEWGALVVATFGMAHADSLPERQALSCPGGATSCEIELVGVVKSQKRHVKWDDIQLTGTGDGIGRPKQVFVSINIPHRKKLGLRTKQRYRIVVAASAPFGAGDLWITSATPLE